MFSLAFGATGPIQAEPPASGKPPAATSNPPTTDTASLNEAAYHELSQAELDALLGRLSQTLGAVKSFQSTFTQERHLALFMDTLTGRGICYFQAPDRFRWELRDPYTSVLILNHHDVGKFEPDQGRLKFVLSGAYPAMRQLLGQMTAWMRGEFGKGRGAFTIAAREGPDYRLIMTPREKKLTEYIRAIEMVIRKDTLQATRLVIREPQEDFIEIRFTETRENIPLDPKLFDLKNPISTGEPHETAKPANP